MTLCTWTVDVRQIIDLATGDYLELNVSFGGAAGHPMVQGFCTVNAYTSAIYQASTDLSTQQLNIYSFGGDTASEEVSIVKNLRANYL